MQSPLTIPRFATSFIAAFVSLLAVVVSTGLFDTPKGAADNGDGWRLYCGAGLVPDTPDHYSNWRGGVVVEFTHGEACLDPIPSSALLVLKAAANGHNRTWSLFRLGWLYAILIAAVTAAASWAITAGGLARVFLIMPPLLPLAITPDFTRFFISTFSEPTGLLAAYALVCGVCVLACTFREHRLERVTGLALTASGGLLAVTAKIGYGPVLIVAAAVCAVTTVSLRPAKHRWHDHILGPTVATVMLAAAMPAVHTSLAWHMRNTQYPNVHNLVFTMLLPELGSSAAVAIGLSPDVLAHAGDGFYGWVGYPINHEDFPGWKATIGEHPDQARVAAWRELFGHPVALARAISVGMQATQGRAIDYLPANPLPAGTTNPVKVTVNGSTGHDGVALRNWLHDLSVPWWPALLAAIGIASGLASPWLRNQGVVSALALVAGISAAAAVGIVIVAVLGDGYYEIAKHVWLGAYLLDVTAVALTGAILTPSIRWIFRGCVALFSKRQGWKLAERN